MGEGLDPMSSKTKKELTRADLHLRACHLLAVPPSNILNVVANSAKTKYFIHLVSVNRQGKATYTTELVDAKDLLKIKKM